MTRFVNDTIDRLGWVAQTYAHEPVVAYETIRFALYTVGLDQQAADLQPAYRDFGGGFLALVDDEVEVDVALVASILDSEIGELLSRPHEADRIFPWFAAQMNKMVKAWRRASGEGQHEKYESLLQIRDALMMKGSAISQWSKHHRVDLGRHDAEGVLSAIEDFEVDIGPIPQGKVIYEFKDGWTVQELPPEALKAEGEAMQHCVGGYCGQVEAGEAVIFSLRDPRGKPHVTMEYDPRNERFKQVYGKQNEPPKEEYAARARQFIAEAMSAEPRGMLMAGAVGQDLNLRGVDLSDMALNDADLSRTDLRDANLYGAVLRGANLRGANLHGVALAAADLTGASLCDANLSGADLSGANLNDARCRGANLSGAHLEEAYVGGADLREANLSNANLRRAELNSADLSKAHLSGTDLLGADLRDADLTGAYLGYANLNDADVEGANFDRADLRDADLSATRLSGADLTGALLPIDW
jgi:uncharacterized protein YjbI with pentapeptide repeats